MPALRQTWIMALASIASAATTEVTPVEKVIELLTGLKDKVTEEGKAEATVYDKFACFCKDKTKEKGDAIIKGEDDINLKAAEIETKVADKTEKATDLGKRKVKQEELAVTLKDHDVQCTKDEESYNTNAADLTKATNSLEAAIKALETAKPSSFLAVKGSIEKTLALADALKLMPASKQAAVGAFLQDGSRVDPSDPEYKYHSQGIITTLEELLKEFKAEKKALDDEWAKTKKTCEDKKADYEKDMENNKNSMGELDTAIDALTSETAEARSALVNEEGQMKDNQLYLRDLTRRCESRAQDWDQRATMRKGELEALEGALKIMTDTVKDKDTTVNKRALLAQESKKSIQTKSGGFQSPVREHSKVNSGLSFLQGSSATSGSSVLSMQERQHKALGVIADAGGRLRSQALAALAVRVSGDPFTKVKKLIQELVERLLAEATAEVTKKSYCDKELGKTRDFRDFRLRDTNTLNVEIGKLEAKEDMLKAEIKQLTEELKKLKDDLKTATEDRAANKEANKNTIKDARQGLDAVTEALTILRVFYKQAAKAAVLVQASPVDEDTTGAGFSGAYSGKQTESKGIIGMLEVIKTDFERTIRFTEEAEASDHREFVEFDRVSKTDISGKSTRKRQDEEDLDTTEKSMKAKMQDLQTAQNLLDDALVEIEKLKPTCIDTGMSYEERVAKREEEISALKKALCILDTEGVEGDCSS